MRLRAVLSVWQSVWPLLSRRTVWSPSEDCIKLCWRRAIKNRPARTAPAVTMECFHKKATKLYCPGNHLCQKWFILYYITNVSLFLTSRRWKLVLLFQLLCLLRTALQGVCKIVLFILLLLFRCITATSKMGVYFWLGTLLIDFHNRGDDAKKKRLTLILFIRLMETCFYVQDEENNSLNPEGCRSGFN